MSSRAVVCHLPALATRPSSPVITAVLIACRECWFRLRQTLRQIFARQAVIVRVETVWVSGREVELGLFLGLEVRAGVVIRRRIGACRLRAPRGLFGLRGLWN